MEQRNLVYSRDGTFVLAAFIPFHSEQTVSTELINYARDL